MPTVPATLGGCKGVGENLWTAPPALPERAAGGGGRSGQRTDCQAQHCGAKRQPQTLFVAARLARFADVRCDLAALAAAPLQVEATGHARLIDFRANLSALERRSQQWVVALRCRAPCPTALRTAQEHVAVRSR